MTYYLFLFVIACTIIVIAGIKLSKYGDIIGEKTGLEKGFIGFLLLAFITSVPELVVSISAVSLENSPNLALGNVFGSNMFNLFIIVILDFVYKGYPFLYSVSKTHIVSASLGIIMMCMGSVGLLFAKLGIVTIFNSVIFNIGFMSFVILAVYLISMLIMYKHEHSQDASSDEEEKYKDITIRRAASIFSFLGLVVVIVGVWLTDLGDCIAKTPFTFLGNTMTFGSTFVGTLFMAFATSLPELVVSLGAIKLGQCDMALGNILGSNIFNMSIIFVADLFYRSNSIFHTTATNQYHLVTAFFAIIMCMIVILSMSFRRKKGYLPMKLGWESFLLFFLYITAAIIIFNNGKLIAG
ncbi:sodium:calcium antiporter [bacterium]|nr:sodium:calcium antiporter [bacterium]